MVYEFLGVAATVIEKVCIQVMFEVTAQIKFILS